jgi:hypothetical protein
MDEWRDKILKRYRVSVLPHERVLGTDAGDSSTTLKVLNTTQLYT